MGIAGIAVTAAVAFGCDGFAAASVGGTNDPGPVATSQASQATTDNAAAAAGKKLQYYSIAASGFAPDGLHNTAEDYFNAWDPTTLSNQDSGRCFNAAVHLPNAVNLVSATFYYTAGSVALYGELNEQMLATHNEKALVSFDSTVATTPTYTATVKDISKADQVVNTQNAYSLGVCPSGNSTFSGVTIAFTN
jgi:hypothetical protein